MLSREENTKKAKVGIKSKKRNQYDVFKNGSYIGIMDKFAIMNLTGIKNKDFYLSDSKNLRNAHRLGYDWIKRSVEDIETVSGNDSFLSESNGVE